ncbi:MAG: hypothetical protein ACKVWR_07800 [Acidimicrobiales bacterium]
MSGEHAHLAHLARRFGAGLVRRPPAPRDEAWARDRLREAELALWVRLGPADRRHAIAVARAVDGPDAPAWVAPAALLHDVGKLDAGLGVLGRTLAAMAERAGRRPGGRIGRHLGYPAAGAALLAEAGALPEVQAWAAEHHLPAASWTLDPTWAARLAAADHAP